MVSPVGVVVQRGTRVLLLCVMALVSAACGEDKCDRGGMPASGCAFFTEDRMAVVPERMEHVRSVATPVEVNGGFVEAELVPPPEPRMNAAFFSFQVARGQRYRVNCQGITLPGCGVLALDGAGRLIASPRYFTTGESDDRIAFEATDDGTWYAMAYRSTHYVGGTGTFRFRVQGFGLDVHGDTQEEASLVTPSPEPFSGGLQGPGDQDVFAFTATAGRSYALTCEGPGDSIPWGLSQPGSWRYEVPWEGQAYLSVYAETSGTMFVAISFREPELPPDEVEPHYPAPAYTCRLQLLEFP